MGVANASSLGTGIAIDKDGANFVVGNTNGNLDGQVKTGTTDAFITNKFNTTYTLNLPQYSNVELWVNVDHNSQGPLAFVYRMTADKNYMTALIIPARIDHNHSPQITALSEYQVVPNYLPGGTQTMFDPIFPIRTADHNVAMPGPDGYKYYTDFHFDTDPSTTDQFGNPSRTKLYVRWAVDPIDRVPEEGIPLANSTDEYHKTDISKPLIHVNQNINTFTAVNKPYTDPGAVAWDYLTGSYNPLSSCCIITGGDTVNTAVKGVYKVQYHFENSIGNNGEAERIVTVVDDVDEDGIPDNVEDALLQRFSPFLLFSKEGDSVETFNPTDPLTYVRHSILYPTGQAESGNACDTNNGIDSLAINPYAIFTCSVPGGDEIDNWIKRNPVKTKGSCLDPYLQGWVKHGEDWPIVLDKRNVGLYGHVARANIDYKRNVPQTNDGTYSLYKIEYWQFFGFNTPHAPDTFGCHDGDWTTVQLLYDPDTDRIVSVFHYAHGGEIRFHITNYHYYNYYGLDEYYNSKDGNTGKYIVVCDVGSGSCLEYRGSMYDYPGALHSIDESPYYAQDNRVRFAMDPDTFEFSHPIVYVEYGDHEFYPSQFGYVCRGWTPFGTETWCTPTHNGDDFYRRYLTANIPNLGEVEHPRAIADLAIQGIDLLPTILATQYSGYWGCRYTKNSSPPGPSLHTEWTYPTNSYIRSYLQGQLEN